MSKSNVVELKVMDTPKKRIEDASEILAYAKKMIEENSLDQVLVIVGKDGVYPQAMMANLTETGALGMMSFTQGLLYNANTIEMPEDLNDPTPEED